jgi:hypothetical protein
MNQINSPSDQLLTLEPKSKPEAGRVVMPKAMPQARRDFDAALRRATQHETDSEDTLQSDEQPDQLLSGLAAFGAFVSMPPGAMAAQIASGDGALSGSAMTASPSINRGTSPDAAPMSAGAAATHAADQQWQINIPSGDALAVRLVSAGAGHWQVRLAADGPTRAQLTPSLGRLRDKLRQRSDERIDDLSFDDDLGPEPGAQA